MTKKRVIARLDFCMLMERGRVCSSSILAQFCAKVIAVDSCNLSVHNISKQQWSNDGGIAFNNKLRRVDVEFAPSDFFVWGCT